MIKLSVIIVNYNVKYFLEQALYSAQKSIEHFQSKHSDWQGEIWVIDNDSQDDSVELVREKFPEVRLVANNKNLGFGSANNQAARLAEGEYILFLNPDTVVKEDTFLKALEFMDANPEAGALGVKMIDGQGNFLPESKRGLPTPKVAFLKVSGLSSLFPKSASFNWYHMGHLPDDENAEVEILSGACMLCRKTALDKVGLFDEDFFMYGEDVDLSYRILKGGFKNYYFADTSIIHYKGESTKKGSLNYVRMFYNAMDIFSQKHFNDGKRGWFSLIITIGIWLRAFLDIVMGFFQRFIPMAIDAVVIFAGMVGLKYFWENYWRAAENLTFEPAFLLVNVPLYILIWIGTAFFSGAYDSKRNIYSLIRGLLIGTLIISAVYGFLNEELRFSRGIILAGAAYAIVALSSLRIFWNLYKHGSIFPHTSTEMKVLIAGEGAEIERVKGLLKDSLSQFIYVGAVVPDKSKSDVAALGAYDDLEDVVSLYNIDEVIFCAKNISSGAIIESMSTLGEKVNYKIVPEESISIIGSNSKNSAGDIYAIDINLNIKEANQKRNKRLVDVILSAVLLITFPITAFIVRQPLTFLKNIFQVFFGSLSWVGYIPSQDLSYRGLPKIREGVLNPADTNPELSLDSLGQHQMNYLYAREYNVYRDLTIIKKAFRSLGREV